MLNWEGGFTTPKFDGQFTLFGATAGTVASHSSAVFGRKISRDETVDYMKWLASGLHGTTIKPETSNVQCTLIEKFRLQQARDLFVQTYIKDLSLDKIRQPKLLMMLAHVSWNGDHAALWALDKMTAELEGRIFEGLMPQERTDGDGKRVHSPYYRPPASDVKGTEQHKLFASGIVDKFNQAVTRHPQAGDPRFPKLLEAKLYDDIRLYYANMLDHMPQRNRKFIVGWLNRYRELNNKNLSTLQPEQPATCDRPIERARPAPFVLPASEKPAVTYQCQFPAYSVHITSPDHLIPTRVEKPAQVLPFADDKPGCERLAGKFVVIKPPVEKHPPAAPSSAPAAPAAASPPAPAVGGAETPAPAAPAPAAPSAPAPAAPAAAPAPVTPPAAPAPAAPSPAAQPSPSLAPAAPPAASAPKPEAKPAPELHSTTEPPKPAAVPAAAPTQAAGSSSSNPHLESVIKAACSALGNRKARHGAEINPRALRPVTDEQGRHVFVQRGTVRELVARGNNTGHVYAVPASKEFRHLYQPGAQVTHTCP